MAKKIYKLRKLVGRDFFRFVKLIKILKIGNLTEIFANKNDSERGSKMIELLINALGNDEAESAVFEFLSGCCDLSIEQVSDLPLNTFFELVKDVVTMPEITDFFGRMQQSVK